MLEENFQKIAMSYDLKTGKASHLQAQQRRAP
jgi:hypothetical protein